VSKAPKKIWLETEDYDEAMLWFLQMKTTGATQYIRSDLVDKLVEALEKIAGGWVCVDEAGLTARAALKALEEE